MLSILCRPCSAANMRRDSFQHGCNVAPAPSMRAAFPRQLSQGCFRRRLPVLAGSAASDPLQILCRLPAAISSLSFAMSIHTLRMLISARYMVSSSASSATIAQNRAMLQASAARTAIVPPKRPAPHKVNAACIASLCLNIGIEPGYQRLGWPIRQLRPAETGLACTILQRARRSQERSQIGTPHLPHAFRN
jgi:hypothetical protein